MTRKLDWPAATAAGFATIGVCTAVATLVVRGPCHEGDGRLLDVAPALPWIAAALALLAGWRLIRTTSWFPRPRPHRILGVINSVALLIVTAFICLVTTGGFITTLGDPTTGCWSF